MKRFNFPWIATGLGLVIAIVMLRGGATRPPGETGLPPLTLLFMSEFGFIVTAAGAFVGVRGGLQQRSRNQLVLGLACSVLALGFIAIGIALWRTYGGT